MPLDLMPSAIVSWTRPVDGAVMVYVPAGEFLMGLDGRNPDQSPAHTLHLEAFWIDKLEVTNSMYKMCVADKHCSSSPYNSDPKYNTDEQPAVGVSWVDAKRYCEWADARLPSEAEWEKAARGRDHSLYPWGTDVLDVSNLNSKLNQGADTYIDAAAPVGSFPDGASSYGVLDMSGNVEEWTSTLYRHYPYNSQDGREDPKTDGTATRVVRGGSWSSKPEWLKATWRTHYTRGTRYPYTGFRCAISAEN